MSKEDEFILKSEEDLKNIDSDNTVTLEIKDKRKTRIYEFTSKEERDLWYRAYCKRKLYTPYFLLGVGINALLYKAGIDLSQDILLGFIVGIGIPFACMFLLSEIHFKLTYEKRLYNS
ncbi:hypothetical protein [Natranaerofaba carboxydovora]|uniref:hypothetical protein n=1 Tax=Natranaerofaba carboxydovora TaxID=2742683 RepID=UPI001F14853B|nr:hypothetical protein [Natranaerofaba carboxydovora]UMZ73596.1 hypothetical protein ACONDI_01158 [Natranaerofaba carboxydovora]